MAPLGVVKKKLPASDKKKKKKKNGGQRWVGAFSLVEKTV